ncbi:hypothetical protein, partial [Lyngbya sp. CCY1209]|uniref:hypothetical protein n=1 Tax=Lyngbya sp. CCY1209 TaxID=2886103 RepID=UPI002D216E9C
MGRVSIQVICSSDRGGRDRPLVIDAEAVAAAIGLAPKPPILGALMPHFPMNDRDRTRPQTPNSGGFYSSFP